MWLEKLKELSQGGLKGPIKYLDLNFELHNAIYVIETLDDIFDFSLDEDLVIQKDKEILTKDEFLYWWQVTRYGELLDEEHKLINSFEEVKKKMAKLQKTIPKPEEEDTDKEKEKKQKKIEDINSKLSKLATWMNKEGPILKNNLQILSKYRSIYASEKSLTEILRWIEFYLKHQ